MHHTTTFISLYGTMVSTGQTAQHHHHPTQQSSVCNDALLRVKLAATKISRHLLQTVCRTVAAMLLLLVADTAYAQNAAPVIPTETSNASIQTTWIVSEHPPFRAAYSGTNSLLPIHEKAYTWTVTAYFGYRPFADTELYFNPEMIQSTQYSGLHGLGGFNNNENQKAGETSPTFYRARLFARQTWNLGGEKVQQVSGPNQLAGSVDANRVVLTVGNIATPDIFDNNLYAHDARTQFMNWTFYSHIMSDFPADGRGYTWGTALEYYRGDWVVRIGQFVQPKESNGLYLEHSLTRHPGQQIEIEHAHTLFNQPGKLRLLAFRNHANMGNFDEAVTYARLNGGTPDLANVRRDQNKIGAGINLEQAINDDVGVFARAGFNNGKTETYQFAEVDRSISGGAVIKGRTWGREKDTAGIAAARNGISAAHRAYLAAGGLGAFIGDGKLPNYRAEQLLEAYYNFALNSHATLALDYQHIANPAYNADRGPLNTYAVRLHLEY